MTIDDLDEKLDHRFDLLDEKIDDISRKVAIHDNEIQRIGQFNDTNSKVHDKLDTRVRTIEKWMWIMIGAGATSGGIIAKLFIN